MKTLKRKAWEKKLASLMLAVTLLLGLCPQTLHASGIGTTENNKGFTWTETYNMAITEDPAVANGLPTSLGEDVYTKWATCIGLWQGLDKGEVSNPVFLNGSLYIYGEKQLKKIDPKTGAVEKTVNLANSTAYNYFFQTAGDKLVIQEGLVLEAFDADLNSLWVTESMGSGSQGLTPLNYADGVVYGGTVAPGGRTGCYFAVNMADGSILWKQEAELVYCGSKKNYTGYYWAGAAIIGDYLVYGGEGGRVYSTNRSNGEIVDRYDISPDFTRSIRSSVAYDGKSIYFTDTNGRLYQVEYDATNGSFGSGKSQLVGEKEGTDGFGSTCTATPVIYKNRLYVGDATCLAVFDTTDLSLIYRVKHSFSTLRDLRLVADTANNCVYVFTSYYKNPGSVVLMKDAPGQTDGELVDFAPLTKQWMQYNASMPIWGPDGTIYLTNDLGYLIAIGKASTWLTKMSGSGSFDNELNNGISDYEMVVAPGTQNAQLILTVNEGSTLRVNGKEIPLVDQTGTAVISLKDSNVVAKAKQGAGSVTANIEVEKGDDIRSYRVVIREASQNAEIANAMVNQSNSLSSPKEVKQLEDNVYICYGQNSTFMRLWIKLADEGASQAVYALNPLDGKSKVDNETGLVGNTANGTGTGAGYLRWNLYWKEAQIVVKVQTTAEDGITSAERYYIITQAKEADFTGSQAETDVLALIHKNAETDALIQELKAYYNQKNPGANYREEQQTELLEKLNAGIAAIKAATSKEEQAAALAAAKSALDEVKSDAELSAEQLASARKQAVTELNAYLDIAKYRAAQQKEIKELLAAYEAKLLAADSLEAVDALVKEGKAALDKVKTDEELTQEEQKQNQGQNSSSGEQGTKPKTGDTAGNWMILYVVLAVASLGMLVLLLQRKRQQ